ncbi:MAG TPA: hypothetical protein VN876_09140 [Gemmatimonadaceae bacterium]|nr:hypothetical protein [Gemmatimonadaceae bacterium]
MRLTTNRIAVIAFAAIACLTVASRTAEAQLPKVSDLHPSFYGSTELDTRHSQFYLLGMYVGVGGLGWSPYFNVNAYSLHYRLLRDVPASASTLSAASPTVGMAYAGRSSGVSLGAGYTWVQHPDAGAPGAEGGGSNGASASLGAYQNGTGRRPMHTQLLANYNFGSQYGWARGRASVPFGYSNKHPARIGAEVVDQGGGKDPAKSNSFQAGPTFEYTSTPQFRTTGAVGYKSVGGARFASRESAPYLKLEFSFSP